MESWVLHGLFAWLVHGTYYLMDLGGGKGKRKGGSEWES